MKLKNETPIVINEEQSYGVPAGYGANANQIPDDEWCEVLERARKSESTPAPVGTLTIEGWKFGGVHSRAVYDARGREICVVSERWQTFGGATRTIGNLIASAPALLAALKNCEAELMLCRTTWGRGLPGTRARARYKNCGETASKARGALALAAHHSTEPTGI